MRVLALGEALVDWISTVPGADLAAAASFAKAAGGSPFNVAVALARLGVPTAFAGRFGDDPFGAWLAGLLAAEGVDLALAGVAPGRATRMAYVVTDAGGDRVLAHFSPAGADAALTAEDLPAERLLAFDWLVFGSLMLRDPGARAAALHAAAAMRRAGKAVLFDPNPRPALWPGGEALRAAVDAGLAACTVAKLGDDELRWHAGHDDLARAATALRAAHGLDAVLVTAGPRGAAVFLRDGRAIAAPGFAVELADATGAGDACVAGLLAHLPAWDAPDAAWRTALRYANALGALACTRPGAIAGLPSAAGLEAWLAGRTSQPGPGPLG